jgi:hypothetical protein
VEPVGHQLAVADQVAQRAARRAEVDHDDLLGLERVYAIAVAVNITRNPDSLDGSIVRVNNYFGYPNPPRTLLRLSDDTIEASPASGAVSTALADLIGFHVIGAYRNIEASATFIFVDDPDTPIYGSGASTSTTWTVADLIVGQKFCGTVFDVMLAGRAYGTAEGMAEMMQTLLTDYTEV